MSENESTKVTVAMTFNGSSIEATKKASAHLFSLFFVRKISVIIFDTMMKRSHDPATRVSKVSACYRHQNPVIRGEDTDT